MDCVGSIPSLNIYVESIWSLGWRAGSLGEVPILFPWNTSRNLRDLILFEKRWKALVFVYKMFVSPHDSTKQHKAWPITRAVPIIGKPGSIVSVYRTWEHRPEILSGRVGFDQTWLLGLTQPGHAAWSPNFGWSDQREINARYGGVANYPISNLNWAEWTRRLIRSGLCKNLSISEVRNWAKIRLRPAVQCNGSKKHLVQVQCTWW